MKTKFFLFALMALLCVACSKNNPEQNKLLGTWAEPYHVETAVKSLTFNADATLVYVDKPDTTWNVVIDWGGDYAKLHYAVKSNDLYISGTKQVFDETTSTYVDKPFNYSTSFSIEGERLTIDSFAYNGESGYFKQLILYRQP